MKQQVEDKSQQVFLDSSMPLFERHMSIDDPIYVRSLSAHYGVVPVLWDLSFSIPKGSLVGIMGPNGAGKSTLMKAILGLIPSIGSVSLLGERSLKSVHKKIAYVPQKEQVDWDFPITVRDLVEMGLYPKKGLFSRIREEDLRKVDEAIQIMGLKNLEKRQISQLSGGQQQRAFLARAWVQDAELYFLDEPFAGVDVTSEKIIIDVLKKLQNQGKTILVVHHDISVCREYFSWVLLLNTRLVAIGKTSDVMTDQNLRLTYGRHWQLAEDVMQEALQRTRGE